MASEQELACEREIARQIKAFLDQGIDVKILGETLIVMGASLAARHQGPRDTAEFLRLSARKIEGMIRA